MKRSAITGLVFAALASVCASAQQERTMTVEDVIATKSVSDPQVSPDGRWAAYVVTTADLKEDANDSDIWLVSTAAGEPMRLTTSKKNDSHPRWSPDGKRIAFLSAREDKPQIFLIRPFGGEAERLTESKTGVQSFQWSPDGSRIAYVARQEPTAEEEKKQKDKDDAQVVDKTFKHSRIWVIEVQSKKATELVKGDFTASDPQWSPDGKHLAYVSNPTPKADDGSLSDIWIIALDTGKSRKLIDNDGPDAAPRWSPDGNWIAYLSRDAKNGLLGQLNLMAVPVAGGTPRQVAPELQYQPGPALWSPDGKALYFVCSVRTTSQLFSAPVSGVGGIKQLSSVAGVLRGVTFSDDGTVATYTRADRQHPEDVYVAKSQAIEAGTRLTDHNPHLREIKMGKSEVIRWNGKDGMEIEGLLTYPVGYEKGKRYPTIALIHGGPSGVWSQSFPGSWGNFGQVWAGRSWVVFYPNVRGSSGYGEKFLLANVRDWGGGDYQDIQSGIDYLVSKGIADPDRLGQAGWSYGGYMTAWTLTQTNRFKAVMVGAGLTNMFSMYSTNDLQQILEGYFGGQPWDDVESYWKRSPMAFIKQAKTPTLIMHGGSDTRVPLGQAQELYMGLRKNDVPVEMVVFPREPHGLQEPRHRLDKMRREYAWFSKWVLGVEEPEPKPAVQERPSDKPSSGQ